MSVIALAVAGCSNGRTARPAAEPEVQSSTDDTARGATRTGSSGSAPATPVETVGLPADPPVPTISPNEFVASPAQPAAMSAPVPAPRDVVEEEVRVAEKTVVATETDQVVETATQIVERKETVETSERVVDQVEVMELTETTVETVQIDNANASAFETDVKSAPVEEEMETVTVVTETGPIAADGPMDAARIFSGPGKVSPASYGGYGVFAIRSDMPASERDRLVMLCDAFVAALPATQAAGKTAQMVTLWPVASAAHAEELNAGSGAGRCESAVEHYNSAAGQEAISDSERTGWILDNQGPYLLAWSPPTDKGASGASVLLVDLSNVEEPENAGKILRHWSEDVEHNSMLWGNDRWDQEELNRVVNDWRGEFGPRSILLLGAAGG